MTREKLAEQHRAIIRRYSRTLADADGTVPDGLLDELATVAEQHATEAVGEVVTSTVAGATPKRPRRSADQTTDRIPIA